MTTQPIPISLGKAAKKYDISQSTLSRWAKWGLLKVLQRPGKRGQKLLVDEGEVAWVIVNSIRCIRKDHPISREAALLYFQTHPTLIRPHAPLVGAASQMGGGYPVGTAATAPTAVESSPSQTKDLVDRFHTHNTNLSPQTQTFYDVRLYPFADYFPTLPTRPEQIEQYIDHCRQTHKGKLEKKVSERYLFGIFNCIKTFYHWLVEFEYIPERQSPMPRAGKVGPKAKGPPKPKQLPRTFTDQEVVRIVQAADKYQDRVMAELLFVSGIRSGELCSLTDADIFPDHVIAKGKTGEHHYLITPELYNEIQLMGRKGYLFLDNKKQPLRPDGVYQRISKMAKKAGITGHKLGPHTLRHTFGRDFQRDIGDLVALQKLLQHTQISTTRVYAELADTDVDKKYRKFDPGRLLPKQLPLEPGEEK